MKYALRALMGAFLLLGTMLAQTSTGSCKTDGKAIGANTISALYVLKGATVKVCADNSNTAADCTGVPVYSDPAMTQAMSNPFTTADGNYTYCVAPGDYQERVTYAGQTITQNHVHFDIPAGSAAATNATNTFTQPQIFEQINQVRYADQFPGADIGAKVNAAIADLGTGGGKVRIPKSSGTYAWSTAISADLTVNVEIECDGGISGGSSVPTILVWSGSTTPILARSSTGFHFHGCAVWWSNATAPTTIIDAGHAGTGCGGGGCDSNLMEIDHNQFRKSGSGGTATQIVNADKLISSRIHDNIFANYQYGIMGASLGSYSTAIYVESNHFDTSSGTCSSGAHIANPHQGWTVVNNTFEMGSGTCQVIGYTGGFTGTNGILIAGSWIGDNPVGDTISLFTVNGGGWQVEGNFIAGGNSNLATGFSFQAGVKGFVAQGNTIQNLATAFSGLANVSGILIGANSYTSVTAVLSGTQTAGITTDSAGATTIAGAVTTTSSVTAGGGGFKANQSAAFTTQHLLVSASNPTISSGFGTGAAVQSSNGTAAFSVNVGTGGAASTGVVGLPTASGGWTCFANDVTTPASNNTKQSAASTTTATFINYNTSGVATAWPSGDVLNISCHAY